METWALWIGVGLLAVIALLLYVLIDVVGKELPLLRGQVAVSGRPPDELAEIQKQLESIESELERIASKVHWLLCHFEPRFKTSLDKSREASWAFEQEHRIDLDR